MTEEEIMKLTVGDVIGMDEFAEEMKVAVSMEQNAHSMAIMDAKNRGMVLKRLPIDALRDKGVMDGVTLTELFAAVIDKSLVGFSATERQYIWNLGMLCFGRVLKRLRERETQ